MGIEGSALADDVSAASDIGRRHPRSFEDFYRAEFTATLQAARAFTGNRDIALDATQEAFGRAYARWKRLADEPWANAWVTTTALNHCRRHWRRLKREAATGAKNELRATEPTSDRVDLLRSVRSLPERQRQAVILHYLGDLPVAVVAVRMGLSEGAVKAHLFKARARLRSDLEVRDA